MKSVLKILIAVALFTLAAFEGSGQVLQRHVTGTPFRDSVTGAGTKYFTFGSTSTGLEGLSVTALKAATGGGTVSSYAILQVRTDTMPSVAGAVWEDYVYPGTTRRDTLFLTDIATAQGHQWAVTTHFFNGARAKVVSTGAQKFYVYFTQLRR